jgi:diguanylate cyclase (GGDEF)-like protein
MTNPPTIEDKKGMVERELARRLAASELASVRTSFFGYGLLALLLRDWVTPAWLLAAWVCLVLACELGNGVLAAGALRRIDEAAKRRRLLAAMPYALFVSGTAWGLAALLPGIERSAWAHALTLLVLAVVGMFSANNLCARRGCVTSFNLGLALPTLYASLIAPGRTGPELGISALGMLAIVQVYSEVSRKLVLGDARAHVAMEAMASQLRRSNEELTIAMERLSRIASFDPLTQCMNRRAFMEKLDFEISRHSRYGTSFGVVLLDVDRFKSVNDRYGHEIGDRVLVAAAECLRAQLRPVDSLARWGGEEFLCLVAHVVEDDLLAKAEDLRLALSRSPLVFEPQEIAVTASFGAAVYRAGQSGHELIAQADRAMYRAKVDGRNRVLLGTV